MESISNVDKICSKCRQNNSRKVTPKVVSTKIERITSKLLNGKIKAAWLILLSMFFFSIKDLETNIFQKSRTRDSAKQEFQALKI